MNTDGIINGSSTNDPEQTLWHRIALEEGILLRSSAHCNYLCINECGYGYSAVLPNSECLWSEIYDEHNYRFFFKQFGNRTAYLSLNLEGRLKRTVLLKKELLGSAVEQSHVLVKNYEKKDYNKTCKSVNKKKIGYVPMKTCKNPPRDGKKMRKDKRDSSILDELNVIERNDSNILINKMGLGDDTLLTEMNNTLTAALNETLVDKMGKRQEITNEIPLLDKDDVVYIDGTTNNKTKEGAVKKNYYYHDEAKLSIQVFDEPVTKKPIAVRAKNFLNATHTELGQIINELVSNGNTTKNSTPFEAYTHRFMSLKICFTVTSN